MKRTYRTGNRGSLTAAFRRESVNSRSALGEQWIGEEWVHRVLASQSALDALELAQSHEGSIDVPPTDVVVPGLWGTVLAHELQKSQLEVRVIYISGNMQNLREEQIPRRSGILRRAISFGDVGRTA
jgi:hypothetical protein